MTNFLIITSDEHRADAMGCAGHSHLRTPHLELARTAAFFDYDRHFDAQTMRAAKCAYFGLTSFMDNCVGKILDALERSGQTEDTVICYISDHGELLGDHGLWTKQVMYEGSVAVPMILSGSGIPAGHICHTPVPV